MNTAEQKGYVAFFEGKDHSANPYVSHSVEWFDWNAGYEQAFNDCENAAE